MNHLQQARPAPAPAPNRTTLLPAVAPPAMDKPEAIGRTTVDSIDDHQVCVDVHVLLYANNLLLIRGPAPTRSASRTGLPCGRLRGDESAAAAAARIAGAATGIRFDSDGMDLVHTRHEFHASAHRILLYFEPRQYGGRLPAGQDGWILVRPRDAAAVLDAGHREAIRLAEQGHTYSQSGRPAPLAPATRREVTTGGGR